MVQGKGLRALPILARSSLIPPVFSHTRPLTAHLSSLIPLALPSSPALALWFLITHFTTP